jgi:hypothetical protein
MRSFPDAPEPFPAQQEEDDVEKEALDHDAE